MADMKNTYSKYLAPMAIGGALGSLFGNQAPDYSNVESQLQQIPGTITPYFQPYIQAGEESLGGLQQQLTGLLQDPGALMQYLGAGYRTSPGMQQSMMQATEAANRAAAAGGQLGSPAEQQALAKQIYGMGEKDYGDYLNRVLGLYGTGVSGLSGLTQLGAGMGRGLAEDLAQVRMSQAGLEEAKMQAEQQSQAGLMGGLGSLLGAGASLFI